ncbi:AAA family ATPase [Cupriavidus basilensis]
MTKLAPPRTRHYVHRARAIGLLRPGLERKLSVLVAPAGFGKTSLLSEWKHRLEEEGCAVGWLSIDADDDDLFQFCAYLLAAAGNACRQAGEPVARRLEPDPLASAEAMIAELLNAVATLPRRLVLVLDDFDRLAAPAIHEAVFRLLRYAPDNLHVLVAGRGEPAFPLSYFEVRGQLLRLDAQALRFDGAETQAFFGRFRSHAERCADRGVAAGDRRLGGRLAAGVICLERERTGQGVHRTLAVCPAQHRSVSR